MSFLNWAGQGGAGQFPSPPEEPVPDLAAKAFLGF